MDVNNVSNVNVTVNVNNYANANVKTAEESTNEAVVAAANEEKKDVYEPSKDDKKVYKPDREKIKAMWADHNAKVESMRKLVEGLFSKQAQKNGVANAKNGENPWKGTQWENDIMIDIDEATRAKAQAEIDEGGYYSVDETAKRLLNFAVALSGGDPSKIGTLRDAVEKGFKQAENMWGGELPGISYDTREAVMQGFDEWEQAGDSSAIKLLNPNE